MNPTTSNSEEESLQLVELGKLGRPHGVRGELRLFLHNPSSELIYSLDELLISQPEGSTPMMYKIHHVKEGAKWHILSLKGIQHRDKAQQLNGALVWIPRSLLPPLVEGEFYVNDLMGISVFCDNEPVGHVVDSREQGGIEVVTVASEFREIQIPVVDNFVIQLDVAQRRLTVHNIEDLPIFEFASKGR